MKSNNRCCPTCEVEIEIDEKGTYTYGCKNLECECHQERSQEGWEERIDKFLETGLKANFVQKAIFGEQIKTILRNLLREAKKEVLKGLLEMADVGEIEELRKGVCYYAQEHDIKL